MPCGVALSKRGYNMKRNIKEKAIHYSKIIATEKNFTLFIILTLVLIPLGEIATLVHNEYFVSQPVIVDFAGWVGSIMAVAYFIDRSMCDGFDSFTVVATDGVCRGQTVVDSMNFWKKEPNSRILTETDSERFFAFFMERVLRKNDGSRWKKDEFKLLHEL